MLKGPPGGPGGVARTTWKFESGRGAHLKCQQAHSEIWKRLVGHPEVWEGSGGPHEGPGVPPKGPGEVGSPTRWSRRGREAHP